MMWPSALLLLGDHLQKNAAGDVLPGGVVDDDNVLAIHHQLADAIESDVLAGVRVVEPAVSVFFYRSWHGRSPRKLFCPAQF
jgi:hypothetical protein